MKKILFATLFTFMVIMNNINAQRINIDTLNLMLKRVRADSTKSLIYARLCQEYSQSNPDTALYFAQQGLMLARSIGFVHGEAACLNVMAGTFSQTGNYVKALELNLQSLKKAESIGDEEMLYDDMTSVSAAYWNQQDNKKSLEYSLKAKNMAIANKMDSSYVLNAYINLGDGFEKNNLLDSARYYGMLSYGMAVKYGDTTEIGGALNVLGNTYSKLKQSNAAMAYFKEGIFFSTKANDFGTVCDHYLGIARLFQEGARNDSSLYYAKKALRVAEENHLSQFVLTAIDFLARFYRKAGTTDSAYVYLYQYSSLKDSMFSREKISQMQNLGYEENLRQQEIAAQKKRTHEQQIRNLQLLGIGIFIPVFFMIVLFLSRTKVSPRVVEFLGILSLLLLFEFITDLIYPYVGNLTNENPIWEMLILVVIAAILEPLNNRLEHFVKQHLVHKTAPVPVPVISSEPAAEQPFFPPIE